MKLFRKKKIKTRRYIHPTLGVTGFFEALNEAKVPYAVLRWFEDLPHIEPGEDIDLLVADEAIETVSELFKGRKGRGIPVDLYSESGLPGSDFAKIAYYPVNLAGDILANCVTTSANIRVPAPFYHLMSMAFHAVYHKGYRSGIPSELGTVATQPEHDYSNILAELAERYAIPFPSGFTLESLDLLLKEKGWQPPIDTLEKLCKKNPWIKDRYFSKHPDADLDPALHGLCCFIVREAGEAHLATIEEKLFTDGFDILESVSIPPEKRAAIAQDIRGGNWRKGPWPKDGGLPAHLIVVGDTYILKPSEKLTEKHIGLTNARSHKTKIAIRNRINATLPASEHNNPLHSSDNARQALDYLESIMPGLAETTIAKAHQAQRAFQTPFPVLSPLSNSARRAKVELIDFHGKRAICKTFKAGRERYLEREVLGRELLTPLGVVTPILERGPNYIVIEWCENHMPAVKRRIPPAFFPLLPLSYLEKAKAIISHLRQEGYEYIDFSPENFLISKTGELRLIDFEFLQPGTVRTASLEGNYAWYPLPADFKGDIPEAYDNGYPFKRWRRHFGIPLAYALHPRNRLRSALTRSLTGIYLAQKYGFQNFVDHFRKPRS